jgi:hypothetical protein
MNIPEIKLAGDLFPMLENGRKRATIRLGQRDIKLGRLDFRNVDTQQTFGVHVREVRVKYAKDMTLDEAVLDCAESTDEMMERLERFYPDINGDSIITIVLF